MFLFVFASCRGFLEEEETDEEFYSRNPHCTIFFYNQTDKTVYVRVDCRFSKDNLTKWIMEGNPKEIKKKCVDSLCVLATASNGMQPSWLDLQNNDFRDSLLISVFDTFKKTVRYDVGHKDNYPIRQYGFAVQSLGVESIKNVVFCSDKK